MSEFNKLMQMLRSGQGSPTKDGKASSIWEADNMTTGAKLTKGLNTSMEGGALINTNAKDAGGYTDVSSSAMDGAQKGMAMGGPWGAAIGAVVGTVKGFQNRRTEKRNNMTRFETAGRQQVADSYNAFDRIIGRLR